MSLCAMSACGSKRVIATLTRSVPQRCRRWPTMRLALRSVGQLLIGDDHDLRGRSSASSTAGSVRGQSSTTIPIHRRGELDQTAHAGRIK